MSRERFPLTSDQFELLLAFEKSDGLQGLAEVMAKDASVVSRSLQRLAEDLPVMVKAGRRWQITPLGRQINEKTRIYLKELEQRLDGVVAGNKSKAGKDQFMGAALLVINAQEGLLDPTMGNRCNKDAEQNIQKLLLQWRRDNEPVLHIRHVSENRESLFFKDSRGADFLPELAPEKSELSIKKSKSGAFSDTPLLKILNELGIEKIVLTGFTANECIDATARQASDLGFSTFVVGDATATFDFHADDGKLYKADRVHKLILANLHALFAKVVKTKDLIRA